MPIGSAVRLDLFEIPDYGDATSEDLFVACSGIQPLRAVRVAGHERQQRDLSLRFN